MPSLSGFLRGAMPFLAAGLQAAGPAGAIAANMLGKVLNIKKADGEATTPDDIENAIAKVPPDQLSALLQTLKSTELEYAAHMKEMGYKNDVDLLRVDADDRANARARQIALKDWIPAFLAIAVTFGFFAMLGLMMKYPPPPQNKDLLNIMLGSLGTAWIGVITYYFGSSAGSERKTELMAGDTQRPFLVGKAA